MAIETLGKSLLQSAKKKSKRQEKKAKIFTGLMLGVQAGNVYLRNKAEKRAKVFWNNNAGVLANATSRYDKGINFWKDDKAMMSTYGQTGVDDWEIAKRNELYKFYKTTELGGATPKDLTQFKKDVDLKIEDEISAYGKKRDLYSQFRDIGRTETNLTEAKTNFLKPIQDKLDIGAQIIKNESSVGGYLLGNLGLYGRGKANLEEVKINEQTLMLPVSYNPDLKKELAKEIAKNTTYQESLSSIDSSVTYTPLTPNELRKQLSPEVYTSAALPTHSSSLNASVSSTATNRNENILDKVMFTIGDKESSIYNIMRNLNRADDGRGQQQAMAMNQILAYSKQAVLDYEQGNANRPVKDRTKNVEYFLEIGINRWIATSFEVNGEYIPMTGPENNFRYSETVSFKPKTSNKTFNLALIDHEANFRTLIDNDDEKNAQIFIEDFTYLTGPFQGKSTFITQLQNIFDNKFPTN